MVEPTVRSDSESSEASNPTPRDATETWGADQTAERPIAPSSRAIRFPSGSDVAHVGPYHIGHLIGRGGMGEVFAGFDPRLERPVAIKRLLRRAEGREFGEHDLRSEARHAARLTHPSIVRLYDVLQVDSADYLISELVDGMSLAELIRSLPTSRLPVERVIEIGIAVASALAYAHERGVVHRDVKAANVLVSKDGEVKLTDFGISTRVRGLGPPPEAAAIHARSGTFSAMSPEQALGDYTDARSDLFSLGALLYELLVGSAPFASTDPATTLRLLQTGRPLPPAEIDPSVPPQVSKLVERLLEKRREDRPESGREVLTALEVALSSLRRVSFRPVAIGGVIERQLVAVCVRLDVPANAGDLERRVTQLRLQWFEALRDAVTRAGGTILSAAGATVLFCIGHPVAQENNCERAIRLLTEFWRANEELSTSFTAGVDCGPLALSQSMPVFGTGAALEEALDIAEHAEPGSISISLGAQTLVRRFFRFAPSVRTLRGRSRTTQLYRVIESISHDLGIELVSTTPLRSRKPQLEKLDRAFSDAGQKAVVTRLIVGDAGVGKSRLLREWRTRAEQAADSILTAYGTAYEQTSPFAPLVRLWRSWFDLHGMSDPVSARARLCAALDQAGVAARPFLPALEYGLGIADPASPLGALQGERRRHAIVDAFAALLLALADVRLVVFVVEDVHFMDRSTLDVLQRLVESPRDAKLLILLTARPELLGAWTLAERIARVEVDRLSQTEAAHLVESIAEGRSLPAATTRRLIELGDGVPLVLEELTRAVFATGMPDEMSERHLLGCPTSLADSVAMRLEGLGAAKELIRTAAALGRESPLEVLRAVVRIRPEEFRTRLHKLVAANLVHSRQAEGTEWCVFSHALVQEAVINAMPVDESLELHARIVSVLDERFSGWVAAAPGRFAHIYAKANAYDRALDLCEQAAVRSIESSSFHEASAHLQTALSLLQLRADESGLERERRLRQRLGPCLGVIDGWSSSAVAENLNRTYALAGANAELRELWALWAHGLVTHDASKVRAAVSALAHVPSSPQQRFATYSLQGVTAFYRGQFSLARKALEQAVAMLPPPGACAAGGDWVDPAIVREWGSQFSVAASLHLCWLEAISERRERVAALLEQAERLLVDLSRDGEDRELRHGLYMRVQLGLTLGDYELYGHSRFAHGDGPLFRLFELAGAEQQYYRCVAQIGEARARVAIEGAAALDDLVDAYARMRALSQRPIGHVFLSTIVAEACLEARDPARASSFVEDALGIVSSEFTRFFAPDAHRVAACHRLELQDFPGVRAALRRARSACIALDAPIETPSRLFEGRILLAEESLRERVLRAR